MASKSRYRDAQLVTVTVAMAKRWRATGKKIQDVDTDKVATLLAAMRAGQWQPDLHCNQPIKLSVNGELQNGNHRSQAVIEYGEPVKCWVWKNP